MTKLNLYEETLLQHIRAANLPLPEREYKFHPVRKWRFDFAWADRRIAVEVEGAVWTGGRHTRGSGFTSDCEKYNQAALLGWRVFRFPTGAISSGEAISFIEEVFA